MDKRQWGDGPWINELDEDRAVCSGLPCTIWRNPMGAFCGYVDIPRGHPMHGVHYTDYLINGIEVHCGLTYSAANEDGTWRFGFDCAHSHCDYVPRIGLLPHAKNAVYRDIHYVRMQCESLAAQLVAMNTVLLPVAETLKRIGKK